MEFSILGPLRLTDEGRSYTPTAPKQRQLLALLILNANHVVTTGSCFEELWGPTPPNAALSTLHSYVLQLRHALKRVPRIGTLQAARRILETRDGGYLLAAEPTALDVQRFSALVREGRAELGQDDASASKLLREALTLWQGSALADVQAGPVLRAHIVGLEEDRLTVLDQCLDAELRLGRHQELLGELSRLVTLHPTHENFNAQLMLALYRSGRRTQALEVVLRLRKILNTDLGIEPSPRVHQLQQAILACDPRIDPPTLAHDA
ncbi:MULTISPECIES: AfsR/SARP family transcriptional regulator [unclassified Streptomyces]|uniref:AfsR/SARP family transcriptional regulator n=1 Tax=unclassified Streptomyces TaxID=2593676 RepID=UPI0022B5FFA8|nr:MULTISPECIES: AfsR/SARP family transcriptional regulator [unclassified Streptomyces]MCZ7414552.1 AfsR/SARP family transcriptional regulator [Streptomyces sp. WMMC897]MCZ7431479.1 AfsR/SARP family transcriptional regulator [Streptomyces sp. WMMC1477]